MTSQEKIDLIARTDPFKLVDEAERLRAENERLRAQLWTDDEVEQEMALARNAIIEECAQCIEENALRLRACVPSEYAAAIRTLKDKP